MEKDRINTLLDKYRRGDITGEEKAFLESWYVQYRESGLEGYNAEDLLEDSAAVKAELRRSVRPLNRRASSLRAAAAAMIILAGGLYFYGNGFFKSKPNGQNASHLSSHVEIAPGGNKATLRLTGGGTIHLSSKKDGIITKDGKLMYSDGTAISTQFLPDSLHTGYAVLSTPKGGQYQVRLPDGSRVWLNAYSILKYPVSFDGLKERRVVLNGEAYFEVTKDLEKPFRVSASKQTVEVLGTRFNINSYAAAPVVKTTLLEGSLRVTPENSAANSTPGKGGGRLLKGGEPRGRLLIPGQQSMLLNGSITVKEVDADEAVAWKNGYFQFNHKNLETALTELARWYDVEIEYMNNEIRKQELAGTISRYARISQVLEKMELTGMMHFRMEGRKIIVE